MANRPLHIQDFLKQFGPFPSPDKTNAYWVLYDYSTLNRYFGTNFADSLWRGLVATTSTKHANIVAGVFFCGFTAGTPTEGLVYKLYCCLVDFYNDAGRVLLATGEGYSKSTLAQFTAKGVLMEPILVDKGPRLEWGLDKYDVVVDVQQGSLRCRVLNNDTRQSLEKSFEIDSEEISSLELPQVVEVSELEVAPKAKMTWLDRAWSLLGIGSHNGRE